MPFRFLTVLCILNAMLLAGCGSKAIPKGNAGGDLRDQIANAINSGDESQVKQLIETQPLLLTAPIPSLNNWTVLHCAAHAGNAKIVQYLLEQGADPYMADDEGLLPADVAIQQGASQDVIDLLRTR